MDNISRDSNSSILPMAGMVVGALALILSGVALAKISTVNHTLADQAVKVDKIDNVAATANDAAAKAAAANQSYSDLVGKITATFGGYKTAIESLQTDVQAIKEAAAKKPAAAGKSSENVVAGPGEYIVKAGDTSGTKIAQENNVKLADLMAVNPGVEWNKLKIGQKLKLPVKK